MPCYNGMGSTPSKSEYVDRKAAVILCNVCRKLMDSGQLDEQPEFKEWFIHHLAADVFEGRPGSTLVERDRKLLATLIEGRELPIVLTAGQFIGPRDLTICKDADGELQVV
jgi:hypothetical protein